MSQSIIPDEPEEIEVALIAVAYDIVERLDSTQQFTSVADFVNAFREAYSGLHDVVFDYFEDDLDDLMDDIFLFEEDDFDDYDEEEEEMGDVPLSEDQEKKGNGP